LHGLHAAHEAADEMGDPLNIVHRDISPQNIMVGDDGVPRVLDFGIAKAVSRSQSTQEGQVKGKVSYMSPEQLTDRAIDRRADIFAAGIVLWETLTMRRLFEADDPAGAIAKILHGTIPRPSSINGYVSQALDRVVLKALNRSPAGRFQTARDFATALEEDAFVANARKVSEWVSAAAATSLAERAEQVARIESASIDVDVLDDPGQSVESLLTISQTIKLLQEAELHDTRETPAMPDNDIGEPDTTDAKNRRWEASTALLPSRPAEQAARHDSQACATSALPPMAPAQAHEVWTETLLVNLRGPKKRGVVVGGIVALLLIIGAVGLALRSGSGRSVDPLTSERTVAPPTQAGPRPLPQPASPPALVNAAGSSGAQAERPAPVPPPNPAVKTRRMKPAKAAKLAKDCDPPFFIDSDGIRRVKAQCL
jgi:serine/threonine-protein kinase